MQEADTLMHTSPGCGEAKGLAQSRVMVGTPEIWVTTGRLHQFSPGPWAGSWGREEKTGERPPPTHKLKQTHSSQEADR